MATSSRDRRTLLVLGAVAVVALAVFFLVISGSSKKAPVASGPNVVAPPAGSGPSLAPTPHPSAAPLLVFSGRDPFQPLISTTSTSTSDTSGTTPAPGVSPAPAPSSGPTGGSSITLGGHTIVLDDIFTVGGTQKVQVEVDGAVYTVAPGESFQGSYKLVSISGSSANFLYGDQGFTLEQPGGGDGS